VYPRFYYFIRNSLVVLLEPLLARVLKLALSVFACTSFWPTVSFHPLCHRNYFSRKIPCALRSHPTQISPTLKFTRRTIQFWRTCSVGLINIQNSNRGKWIGDGGAMHFKRKPRRPTATLDENRKLSLRPAWLCKSTVPCLHQWARVPCFCKTARVIFCDQVVFIQSRGWESGKGGGIRKLRLYIYVV